MRYKHRAGAANLSGSPGIAKQTAQAIADVFAQTIEPVKGLRCHLPHGFETGRDGHRIRIEGSTMMHFERAGVIEDRHHAPRSADGAHRKSAADNLSESRQIRRDAVGVKRAMIVETKVQHLVGDQNDSVTRGLFAQEREKSRARRNHPDSQRHRIHQQGGQIVLVAARLICGKPPAGSTATRRHRCATLAGVPGSVTEVGASASPQASGVGPSLTSA